MIDDRELCACGHGAEAHDDEGVCQVEGCECERYDGMDEEAE